MPPEAAESVERDVYDEIKQYAISCYSNKRRSQVTLPAKIQPRENLKKSPSKFEPWMWAVRFGVLWREEFDSSNHLEEKVKVFWKHFVAVPSIKKIKWSSIDVGKKSLLQYAFNKNPDLYSAFESDHLISLYHHGMYDIIIQIKNQSNHGQVIKGLNIIYDEISKKGVPECLQKLEPPHFIKFASIFDTEQFAAVLDKREFSIKTLSFMNIPDDKMWQILCNMIDRNNRDGCIKLIQASESLQLMLSDSFEKMGLVFDSLLDVKFFTVGWDEKIYRLARYLPPFSWFISNSTQDALSTKLNRLFEMHQMGFLLQFTKLFFCSLIFSGWRSLKNICGYSKIREHTRHHDSRSFETKPRLGVIGIVTEKCTGFLRKFYP